MKKSYSPLSTAKRCKNGYKRSHRTGRCVPKSRVLRCANGMRRSKSGVCRSVKLIKASKLIRKVRKQVLVEIRSKRVRRSRCPKGTHKSKSGKNCVKVHKKSRSPHKRSHKRSHSPHRRHVRRVTL
jgi:hypothetical protein